MAITQTLVLEDFTIISNYIFEHDVYDVTVINNLKNKSLHAVISPIRWSYCLLLATLTDPDKQLPPKLLAHIYELLKDVPFCSGGNHDFRIIP